jgi:glycerol uptake facilitator-like aquaporin
MFVQIFFAEFIGTFLFLGTIFSVVKQNSFGIVTPLTIGAALSTSIYMTGKVSGGHYNPAVSLMDYTATKLKYWEGNINSFTLLALYWTAQILAGQVSMLLLNQVLLIPKPLPIQIEL